LKKKVDQEIIQSYETTQNHTPVNNNECESKFKIPPTAEIDDYEKGLRAS
jgi:hypothetical protein